MRNGVARCCCPEAEKRKRRFALIRQHLGPLGRHSETGKAASGKGWSVVGSLYRRTFSALRLYDDNSVQLPAPLCCISSIPHATSGML